VLAPHHQVGFSEHSTSDPTFSTDCQHTSLFLPSQPHVNRARSPSTAETLKLYQLPAVTTLRLEGERGQMLYQPPAATLYQPPAAIPSPLSTDRTPFPLHPPLATESYGGPYPSSPIREGEGPYHVTPDDDPFAFLSDGGGGLCSCGYSPSLEFP
jgi:hypothetical protein